MKVLLIVELNNCRGILINCNEFYYLGFRIFSYCYFMIIFFYFKECWIVNLKCDYIIFYKF